MAAPPVDPISVVAATVATKTFGELLAKLTASVLSAAGKPIHLAYEAITTNFAPHLEATYQRCTKIKTILNREEPVDLFSIYVGSNFSCSKNAYDDYKVIEEIRVRKRAVISGTGGSGKTIFMKYLWLSLFENPEGKIPAFIELRKLNEISTDNLLAYIHHSIVNTHANVSEDTFRKTMAKGSFAFLFDGFDEVAPEKRAEIGRQIQELAENNPECIVVVSSRPDDELFGSWQAFSIFKVQPLSQKQVIDLIRKLQYDEIVKTKFVARIEKDLYAQHSSFLCVPLLATMMLMTFSEFADIPKKTHLFYDKAFDTLFYKHDAVKGLFQRKTYTGLPIDTFKRYFSTFCLVSYFDGKLEFDSKEIIDILDRGLRIEKAKIDIPKFLQDLVESVCILQRDGNLFVFSHRSFQEYFAAFCLDRVIPDRQGAKVLKKISVRPSDTTFQMLFDMNAKLVENEFVLPILSELERSLKGLPPAEFIKHHMLYMKTSIELKFDSGRLHAWTVLSSYELERPLQIIGQLYDGGKFVSANEKYWDQDEIITATVFPGGSLNIRKPRAVIKKGRLGRAVITAVIGDGGDIAFQIESSGVNVPDIGSLDWLSETGYAKYCSDRTNALLKIKARVKKSQKAKSETIDQILDL